jgi:hypothetical protein
MEQWEQDLKNREGVVNNNIIKGFVGDLSKANEDGAVQVDHKGLSELSEDELLALYSKLFMGVAGVAGVEDALKVKNIKQQLALIKNELSKRKQEAE